MPIERVLNLPFPNDLTDISSVQEYLQRLYVALTENSYLLVEDIQREANPDASYVVVSSNDNLTNERILTAGNGITLSDGGAGGNMAVAVDSNDVFLLDQTTPQTVVNGIPLLDQGHDDFSELKEFVNKDYVDWAATAIGANYYMTDDDDTDTGYKVCSLTPSVDSETYIEISGITDDQLLGTWISDVGEAPTKLLRGIFDWFIFAEKTSGTKTLRLYWKLYERKTDDSEVLVATSSESNELDMGVKTSYIVPLTLDSDYTPDSGSRIVGKIYASVSGSGNAPTVKIYYQGVSGSRWEIPSSTEILDSIYVKQADHTKATHDALGIDAETTDGYHLDQDVRTTASPTFNDLTLSSPSNIYNLSHDSFADFVANEHIDHTSVTLTAGTGLIGGGDISASRTFNVDVGIADNKILQVDQASGLTAGNLVRATSSGLESRTDAEILAQLSGKASSAFDWNGQKLDNIPNLSNKTTASWSKTIGSGGDYATWADMIVDMPDLIAHQVTVTIKKGTTLTETCELSNKHGLTNDAGIIIQAENYFPKSGAIPTATGATSTTLQDTNQSWTTNEFQNCWVLIVAGTGTDNGFVQITGNDATSLTVASWPGTQPDNTSKYIIVGALIDGGETRSRNLHIFNNSVYIKLNGIGIYKAKYYGITAYRNFYLEIYYCGFCENGVTGIQVEFSFFNDLRYCGIVKNNTLNSALYGGVVSSANNFTYIHNTGISDNNKYGIHAKYSGLTYIRDNFGNNNGTWGAYAEYVGQIRVLGTECSGSSGNHSDPGTADTAGADQASAFI